MTDAAPARVWLARTRTITLVALTSALPFALAGGVLFATTVALRRLRIPVANGSQTGLFESLSAIPWWIEPVTLEPSAVIGLKLPLLVATLSMWTFGVGAFAIASGLVWWWFDPASEGPAPPLSRLGWLWLFGALTALGVVTAEYLLGGLGWPTTVATIVTAVALGHVFAAPVAIVLDGRRPLAALRWNHEEMVPALTAPTAFLVVVFALLRTEIATLGRLDVFGPEFAGTIVLGAAILGPVHAFVMLSVYWTVAGEEAPFAATDPRRPDADADVDDFSLFARF